MSYATKNNRCICTFIPSTYFFEKGIDMDDALNSNPSKFRMLRALWKLSFVKVDDEENQALVDIILKRNEEDIFTGKKVFNFSGKIHDELKNKVSKEYSINADRILSLSAEGKKIGHEMAIEAALCEILVKNNKTLFGKWDYVSHQVIASPFKAVDYMDKMDIFGYRNIPGYSTKSKYLVIEIKKDKAKEDTIEQIMKYVDWIQTEYVFGDYGMIEAYIVASEFPEKVIKKEIGNVLETLHEEIDQPSLVLGIL